MSLLERHSPTVRLGAHQTATYTGGNRCEIAIKARGVRRGDGVLRNRGLLERLPEGSFDRQRAESILSDFGDLPLPGV